MSLTENVLQSEQKLGRELVLKWSMLPCSLVVWQRKQSMNATSEARTTRALAVQPVGEPPFLEAVSA